MQYPLLITGTNVNKVFSVIELIPVDFYITNCPPKNSQLERMASKSNIRAFVLCLEDESEQTIRNFRVFVKSGILNNAKVFVLGKHDDCKDIKRGGFPKDAEFFEYPLNIMRFQDELRRLLDRLDDEEYHKKMNQPEYMLDKTAGDSEPMLESLRSERELLSGLELPDENEERKQILVVDDDPDQLRLIKSMLGEFYDVAAVLNGEQARHYLEGHKADLILLDYLMENENGIEVFRSLKENPETADIPVIFQTCVDTENTVMNILKLKPQGYLIKPLKRSDLLNRIIETLDNDV